VSWGATHEGVISKQRTSDQALQPKTTEQTEALRKASDVL